MKVRTKAITVDARQLDSPESLILDGAGPVSKRTVQGLPGDYLLTFADGSQCFIQPHVVGLLFMPLRGRG